MNMIIWRSLQMRPIRSADRSHPRALYAPYPFSVFADTTRIRIMYALYADELCVGDIASILGLSQSAISHQLRILKDARLVASRREGKTVFYALDDDHVRAILATGMEHVEEK